MINWKVRLRNRTFWLALIPALFLLVQTAANALGIQLNLSGEAEKWSAVVSELFAVLTILGIVNDPTTAGLSDSRRAMEYEKPYQD